MLYNQPVDTRPTAMLTRLFYFFVLSLLLYAVARFLLGHKQRKALHEFVVTLAQALLISAVIFIGLRLAGVQLH